MSAEPTETSLIEATTYRKNAGTGHSYYLDNIKVPSVTAILSKAWPKNLAKWGSEQVAEKAVDQWTRLSRLPVSRRYKELLSAPWESIDRSSLRGTQVHAICERLSRGETVSVPADVTGYVSAYQQFLEDWRVQVLYAECAAFSRAHQIAGTFDLLADLGDGKRWLLDIKTVKEGKSAGWPDHALQGAAYRWMEVLLDDDGKEVPMPQVQEFGVVELSPYGYQLIPMDTSKAVYRVFLHLMAIASAIDDSQGWVSAPLSPPVMMGASS